MNCLIHPKLSAAIHQAAGSKALAACSHLFVSTLYLKSTEREDATEFVPMHSKLSRRVYTTRHYGRMLELLRSLSAVETYRDGSYQAGLTSKSYRLSDEFASEVVPVSVHAPGLEKRLESSMTAASQASMQGQARSWIVESYRRTSFAPTIEGELTEYAAENPANAECARHLVELVAAHQMRFRVSPNSGRVYYPVTNLPKAIRSQLLLDGEEVAEIDATASQPTLLATLYPKACEEKSHYLEAVRSDIYTTIAGWADAGWDRDRAKKEFFNQIAYGSFYNAKAYPLLRLFKRDFPQLTQLMDAIKKTANKALPLRMQKVEAEITIDGACGECAERGIPVLPVHDSLIVRASDAATVGKILSAHWQRVAKLSVMLRGVSEELVPRPAINRAPVTNP